MWLSEFSSGRSIAQPARSASETLTVTGLSVSTRALPWLNPAVDDEPIQVPIDGVLDLHTFQPREVKELVLDYLAECRARGILRVRIIHGKGIGQLRQTVHKLLERHPEVAAFNLANEHFGGWGATIVHLQPPSPNP